MKLFDTGQTREQYLATQIQRSEAKFGYCKVSAHDVQRYAAILQRRNAGADLGPVLCLGTRNGREVDLFRTLFFGAGWARALTLRLERLRRASNAGAAWIEGHRRSRVESLGPSSAIGVELNPRARRDDVWIGSFDAMPAAWSGAFGVVFSNSFDQSQDPDRSAAEWRRVIRTGGYLIFCFANEAAPTLTDPVGAISLEDVRALFPGELLHYQYRGSRAGYSEVILRMTQGGGR
jgi:hypothetical protein